MWNERRVYSAASADVRQGDLLERCRARPPARPHPQLHGLRALIASAATTHGVATAVLNHVRACAASGIEVTVASPGDGWLPVWSQELGARWVEVPFVKRPSLGDLGRVAELRALLHRFDLVHLHSSKAGTDGRLALLSSRLRPPSIYTPHGWPWLTGGRPAPLYRQVERQMARGADAIVAVSHEEQAMGARVLGPSGQKLRVIESGVDTTQFRPDGPTAAVRDAPVIVCAGRLTRAKGQSTLVRALTHLRHRDAVLVLVGDGEDEANLRSLVASLWLDERVEFVGHVPDTAPWLRAADVVAVPSRWDGMSLALLEAMACGAAIVATRVPGISALGDAGVVVAVDQPRELAAAIDGLMTDEGTRSRLGADARQRVVDSFDLDRSVDANLCLWAELTA